MIIFYFYKPKFGNTAQSTPSTPVTSELGAQAHNSRSTEDQRSICEQFLLCESQECYLVSTCYHIFIGNEWNNQQEA